MRFILSFVTLLLLFVCFFTDNSAAAPKNKITSDNKTVDKIEKDINKYVENLIIKGLNLVQKDLKSDVIGFGNLIYKKNPKYFNKMNWDKEFPKLKVNIQSNIKLTTKGSARESIKEAKDEN